MYTMRHRDYGQRIENLPTRAVLLDPGSPAAVQQAFTEWAKAFPPVNTARTAHAAKRKAAFHAATRAGLDDRHAEADAAAQEEDRALQRAQRTRTIAAQALITVLAEHHEEVDAVAARRTLAAYAEEVDSTLDAIEAGARRRSAAKTVSAPRSSLIPEWQPVSIVSAQSSPLEAIEIATNALALATIAGDRCGLIEVVATDKPGRLLTTPRRAEALVTTTSVNGAHGRRWKLADETEQTDLHKAG